MNNIFRCEGKQFFPVIINESFKNICCLCLSQVGKFVYHADLRLCCWFWHSIFDPLPRDVIPASVYMQWNSTPGRLYLMGASYATPKLIVIYGLAVQSSLKSPRYASSVRSTVTHYIYFKWGIPGVAHKQSDRQAESAIGRYKLTYM